MTIHAITPTSLADYLEQMSRTVFKSGISWGVVDSKWEGMREAFDGFDPLRVAGYTPDDVERLMADPGVIHNRRKIEATVRNAGELIVAEREFGSIDGYLKSFTSNDELVRDLHHRFEFMGESTAHFFLFSVGFNVPAQEAWAHQHFGADAHGHGHGRAHA